MRTIAFLNQKGGVGKTTTAANLAVALSMRGLKIAAIDLDPQSHLTMHLGIEPGANTPGVYEMLTEEASLADSVVKVSDSLSVAPACIDLAGAEIELVSTLGREQLLGDRLSEAGDQYDYIIMDCPPSLGLLTLNALTAADEVIIPLQPHFLALQGFGKLLETISLVRRRVNPALVVGGVILCMFESNTRLAGEVTQEVENFLATDSGPDTPWSDAKLYQTKIRRNIKLAECPSFGESIFTYSPNCAGAEDYNRLADEFVKLHTTPDTPATPATPTMPQTHGTPETPTTPATPDAPAATEEVHTSEPQQQCTQEPVVAVATETQPDQSRPPQDPTASDTPVAEATVTSETQSTEPPRQ